jgi:hypothetical protein
MSHGLSRTVPAGTSSWYDRDRSRAILRECSGRSPFIAS